MLDPWLSKNSKFVKKIIAYFYENSNLNKADCLHALCLSEMESMRQYGLKNPIAVIPNGIELTDWKKECILNKNQKKILYLGRLDPKKGIDVFINSIALINNESESLLNGWKIIIAGWGSKSYINQLKRIISKNNLENIIELQGAKYGLEKIDLLKDVDAFILPSYSEGLPMAILEAWSYQLPVIMTKFCNLPEGFNKKAAFEISTNLDEQKKQLMKFFLLSNEELILFGNNGRKLVEDTFSWNEISRQTEILYNWLLSGKKEKPDFVYFYDQI
jgi:poly(glycerol-phosphate) alpha-glucosyltransferase